MHALPVAGDDPQLGRLMQLYMHEWSDKVPLAIGDDALYVYPQLEQWSGDGRDAVLFVDAARLVGFALARRDERGVWHVEEMFVLAGERRRGAGKAALACLVARHPGRWTLTVRPENAGALAFWRRTLGVAPTIEPGGDGIARSRFTFDATG